MSRIATASSQTMLLIRMSEQARQKAIPHSVCIL